MSEQHHSTNGNNTEPTAAIPVSAVNSKPPKKSRTGFSIIIFLLFLLAAAIGAFLWLQHQALLNMQTSFAQQTAENSAQRRDLEAQVNAALVKQQQQLQGDFDELSQRQEGTAARVQALTNITRDDWKLTEVSYLLRMANQRILLEHETANALALAESANTVLSELDSADLFPVRKKLAEEIQSLKMVTKVDREGIYLQLLALTQQIDSLPLIEPLVEDEEADSELQEEVTTTTFWEKVKNVGLRTLHKLNGYVRVRDQGRRVDAILPPEDQMYLKQNLRLMLEQAQTGLLREEQHVYQASLDKAQNWIRDYYPLNEQAEIVLNDLEQLKKNIVQQALPDFSGSASLIKDYIKQKDKLAIARHGAN